MKPRPKTKAGGDYVRPTTDSHVRLAQQVLVSSLREAYRALVLLKKKRSEVDQAAAQHILDREIAFLKHGIGGREDQVVSNAMVFHEMADMEWLTEMSTEKIRACIATRGTAKRTDGQEE